MNTSLTSILTLLHLFIRNNPTLDEVEVILPQVINAISSAKSGAAFSVSFPEAIGGHKGTSTFSWSPS